MRIWCKRNQNKHDGCSNHEEHHLCKGEHLGLSLDQVELLNEQAAANEVHKSSSGKSLQNWQDKGSFVLLSGKHTDQHSNRACNDESPKHGLSRPQFQVLALGSESLTNSNSYWNLVNNNADREDYNCFNLIIYTDG